MNLENIVSEIHTQTFRRGGVGQIVDSVEWFTSMVSVP
jgi:hypothetical protein